MTSTLVLLATALVIFYVGWLAVLWRFQERIVFQPPGGVAAAQVPAREMRYRASDGVELFAYVVGEAAGAHPVIIAFHGNADLARWFVPWAIDVVRETKACVVLPEYRGYDGLSGRPSYEGSRRDAIAALDLVRESLGVTAERTVYFGHSLGSAIAAELAAIHPPASLILQSPFTSARDMARRMVVPGATALWGVISRVHFDTVSRVRALGCRVWVSHGDEDLVVPHRMGLEVFAAARHKGELLIVPTAGHNDVAQVGGDEYWAWLRRAVLLAPLEQERDRDLDGFGQRILP